MFRNFSLKSVTLPRVLIWGSVATITVVAFSPVPEVVEEPIVEIVKDPCKLWAETYPHLAEKLQPGDICYQPPL